MDTILWFYGCKEHENGDREDLGIIGGSSVDEAARDCPTGRDEMTFDGTFRRPKGVILGRSLCKIEDRQMMVLWT